MTTNARKHRIGMLVCSYYPQDPRVRREAEALVGAGFEVDVICLKRAGQGARDEKSGVRVFRLPMDRKRAGKIRYIWDYLWFMILGAIWLNALHARRRYKIVHVHNMPDVLVLCALPARLTGSKIILDLHDPTPEVYQTKFGISPAGRAFKILVALERLSIRLAHLVLTPNVTFRDLFIARGCPPEKIHVVMNSPQEDVFHDGHAPAISANDRPFTLMFHGGIYHRHGLDLVLDAINRLRDRIPGLEFNVYGEGDWLQDFLRLVEERNLAGHVRYHGHVPLETIAAAIASIDIGIIPNRRTPFTEINLPTRIFEYLCAGKPAIVPHTRGIMDYFPPDALFYFDADDPASLADQIMRIHDDPAYAAEVLGRAVEVYRRHTWKLEKENLVEQVSRMIEYAQK
ncbi:glycosyltransferase family 4 protein [bacterium]|nr:glycosyltransferase family 4 protein [bacterium]